LSLIVESRLLDKNEQLKDSTMVVEPPSVVSQTAAIVEQK